MDSRTVVYRIDKNDTVTFVNSAWLRFAQENGAATLTGETVIGRPLKQFIAGKETQHLYDLLLLRVRTAGIPVQIPFRCDSATVRRFMELILSPLADNGVEFAGRLVREEQRHYVPLLAPVPRRAKELLQICSWCKRVKISDAWLEVEEAMQHLSLFDSQLVPALTHGICTACYQMVRKELERSILSSKTPTDS